SCKQMGTAKFTCAGCGGEKTDFTGYDETVHLHTRTVGAVEPTCGEAGYTGDVVCTDCRKTVSTGEIRPATGEHSWELTETLTPASCRAEGQGKFECTHCDAENTDSIGFDESVHLHTKTVGAAAPTCGRAGYTGDVVCEDCGAPISTGEVRPATGEHTYGDWSTVKEPTATETGEKVRVCGVCGDTQRETIPATGGSAEQPSGDTQQSNCVCGGYHTGPFAWLVKFIHRISYFFRNLFN
ncbi:MAG: hypothetical protein K6G90_07020, partial [Clostridia bacterium]|nr:hypothetical protein [Clostridia bacterium]